MRCFAAARFTTSWSKRVDLKRDDVAILRVEQLYPFPKEPLKAASADVPDGTPVFWVQEEPENMGAWRFYAAISATDCSTACRLPASIAKAASPATGSASSHRLEQEKLLVAAFGDG